MDTTGLLKIVCARCKVETNHRVVHERFRSGSFDDGGYWETRDQILECCGCDSATYRDLWESSEDRDESGGPVENVRLYPMRGSQVLPEKLSLNVPMELLRIYWEVIRAFNADLNLLCGLGVRTLVEALCSQLGVTDGEVPSQHSSEGGAATRRSKKLDGKIHGLAEKGHLTRSHAEALHGHRFMGNDSAHRFRAPDRESLKAAIAILEHTIENLYELPVMSRAVRKEGLAV